MALNQHDLIVRSISLLEKLISRNLTHYELKVIEMVHNCLLQIYQDGITDEPR